MLHFSGDFGCFDLLQATVDKQSTICVKNSLYSVPDHLVGQTVVVQLYSEKIRVYDAAHKKMAEHERSYSSGSWTFDINHYIKTLMKKPAPLTFTDSQKTDAFLEIELGSEDVLAQLDGIMQGNGNTAATGRRCAP